MMTWTGEEKGRDMGKSRVMMGSHSGGTEVGEQWEQWELRLELEAARRSAAMVGWGSP